MSIDLRDKMISKSIPDLWRIRVQTIRQLERQKNLYHRWTKRRY
jgi:hypothetical protein